MKSIAAFSMLSAAAFGLVACGGSERADDHARGAASPSAGRHTHADGSTHDERAHADGDAHDAVSLGAVMIGGMRVELAQSHGAVAPGKEAHLVVKLPYTDAGSTVVRAWIGTEDRTLSFVGRGEYAPSYDEYDIHAMAPDPLPPGAMWWIEIQKPDGAKALGSVKPLVE